MKNTTLLIVLITLVAFSSIISAAETVMVKRTEDKPYGRVAFNHNSHSSDKDSGCEVCHHSGDPDTSCSSTGCHAGRNGTITFHKMCLGCHKTRFEKAPIECVGCHKIK
ncbi:MAG: cytochrome c3 family protein [Desulfobacteraceae bacterium]|nr:cytochrome c3 family protein [Desulfobacteraceae bacterium]MBC2756343.1 cytochrome c3 family protein [Desulfobacteraceae bacterium]